jgi:acyl-CoA reductase-like NAD-dependent aldehyde dehydrogenase
MNFSWQSASCGSTSRILAHASIKDEFAARLARKVGEIQPGVPTDPKSRMGAMTFRDLFDRVRSYIEAGKSEGAKLLVGGTVPSDPALRGGFFMTPAVFTDCTRTMRIAREEIFGPIISILGWDRYETMLEIANELSYGLTAVILSRDLDIVHRTAERLNVGYVEVNGTVSWAIGSPFGGYKQSGFGREGNIDELLSYTRTKSVNVRLNPDPKVRV